MKKSFPPSKILQCICIRFSSLSAYSIVAAALLIALVVTSATAMTVAAGKREAFGGEIVRLHVIANSDSEEDQALKLKVRDAVLREAGALSDARDPRSARDQIEGALDDIAQAAKDCIAENHSDYAVDVQWGVFPFPVKSYGNVTLPKGDYRAVRVIIGSGQGKNWWCVMFPPLCFVDESKAQMPASSMDKLSASTRDVLSEKSGQPQVTVRFKLLEILGMYEKVKEFN